MDSRTSGEDVFPQSTRVSTSNWNNWNLMEPFKQIAQGIQISDHLSTFERIALFSAEFCGTAVLVFVGCMGCMDRSHLEISLTFGLALMIAIQCFGHISGPHLNPLVTVAAAVLGNVPLVQVPVYFAGQMSGALAGFRLVLLAVPDSFLERNPQFCSPALGGDVTPSQGLLVEFTLSSILTLVCCGIWDARNNAKHDSVPIRFGFTVTALAMAGISLTGANMNPARSFAPALLNNGWDHHWIYWVGPLSAACFGAVFYRLLFKKNAEL